MSIGGNSGPNEQYQYTELTVTGVVKAGPGLLGGLFVASGTPTIKLWDNASAGSGPVIVNTFQTVAGTFYRFPVRLTAGLYATITGAGDVTFFTSNG